MQDGIKDTPAPISDIMMLCSTRRSQQCFVEKVLETNSEFKSEFKSGLFPRRKLASASSVPEACGSMRGGILAASIKLHFNARSMVS